MNELSVKRLPSERLFQNQPAFKRNKTNMVRETRLLPTGPAHTNGHHSIITSLVVTVKAYFVSSRQ